MRAIMDALSPASPVQRVVFMKAAQAGATEAGNNWVGFVIHQAPGPIRPIALDRKHALFAGCDSNEHWTAHHFVDRDLDGHP